MISHLSLIVFSLAGLTMTIVVQSIPLKSIEESKFTSITYIRYDVFLFLLRFLLVSPSSSFIKPANPSSFVRTSQEKKKRNIDDYDELDDQSDEDENKDELIFNNKNKHVLHAQVKETQAQNHSVVDGNLLTFFFVKNNR